MISVVLLKLPSRIAPFDSSNFDTPFGKLTALNESTLARIIAATELSKYKVANFSTESTLDSKAPPSGVGPTTSFT